MYTFLQGSETSYIYGITFFVFFPVFCVCAAYGVIKVNNSRRKRAKANEPDATCFNAGNGPGLTGVGIKVISLHIESFTRIGSFLF